MEYTDKILITSFEPFGLSGRFIRKANASEDVAKLISAAHPDKYDFLSLPVSSKARSVFLHTVAERRPSGVLCMGENLVQSGDVRVEPYAIDVAPTLNIMAGAGRRKIRSDFVRSLDMPADKSSIGVYYCNHLYKAALLWSGYQAGVPVAFAHVAVLGDRNKQLGHISNILERMEGHGAAGLVPAAP